MRNRLFKRGEKVFEVRYSPQEVFFCSDNDTEEEICEKVRQAIRLVPITGVPSVDFGIANIQKYLAYRTDEDHMDLTHQLVLVPEDSSSSINLTTIT